MAKAKIDTSNGTTIVIEGDPAEVAKIIAQIQEHATHTVASSKTSKTSERKREVKKQQTATDRIVAFKEEGFFNKPKALGEVKAHLQQAGYLYPITTLSGVMLKLVQKKLLTRAKSPSGWVYGTR